MTDKSEETVERVVPLPDKNIPLDMETECPISQNRTPLEDWIDSIGGTKDVAKKIDVNEKTIKRWINGECDVPGPVIALIKMSAKNAGLMRENYTLKDEVKELKKKLESYEPSN